MKKKIIVGIALAMGMFSAGAISASAASSCCDGSKCSDKQAVQLFSQETAGTADLLKAKRIELRGLYGSDGVDNNKVAELEAEIKELEGRIRLVAEKHGIRSCCLS